MNNETRQFAPKKATVPAWFMVLLMVILVAVVGLLVARVLQNQKNKDQEVVTEVEVDPYSEFAQKVSGFQSRWREIAPLRELDDKFDEYSRKHKELFNDIQAYRKETMKKLEEDGIVEIIEDELGTYPQPKEGYSQYNKLIADLDELTHDLSKTSPIHR